MTRLSAPGLCLALAALAGCGGDTTLLLTVGLAAGRAQPDRVRVALFADGRVRSPAELAVGAAGRALPGTIFVGGLDATAPGLRVQVDGLDRAGALASQAAARVTLAAATTTRLTLTLDGPLADSDGDGVPDPIDDCPALPDPDQRCGSGDLGASGDLPALADQALDGGSPACPGFALFCDDFESGTLASWSPTLDKNEPGTTCAITTSQPFRGTHAVECTAPTTNTGPSTFAYLSRPISFAPAPTTVAARAYVRSPQALGAFEHVLALFDGTLGWTVGANDTGQWVVSQDFATSPDLVGNAPFPVGRWVCVELIVDYAPAPRVRVLADGVTVIDAAPAHPTVPSELDVGVQRSNASTASDVLIDDVVLATQPIGCE